MQNFLLKFGTRKRLPSLQVNNILLFQPFRYASFAGSESLPEHIRIKMPQVSKDSDAGKILEWHKKVGDPLTPKDTVCDIQIGDLTIGLQPETEGFLAEISIPKGARVRAGTTVARQVRTAEEIKKFLNTWSNNKKLAIQDLILAYRILSDTSDEFPFDDFMNNHLSVSIPSNLIPGDRTMITSTFGIDWKTITRSNLIEIEVSMNDNANTNSNDNNNANPTPSTNKNLSYDNIPKIDILGSKLHKSLLKHNPNIRVIFHINSSHFNTFSCLTEPYNKLLMLHPNFCRFYNRIIYWNGKNIEDSDNEMGKILSQHRNAEIIVIKNEGVVITAPTISLAFDRLYYLQQSIEIQLRLYNTIGGINNNNYLDYIQTIDENEVIQLSKRFHIREREYASAHFKARSENIIKRYPDLYENAE